ncbi:MAG: hypothetical protein QXP81_09900 [Nitrososphaerota archaeon]
MWITELVGGIIVAGALILLGLGKISFDQSLTLVTLGLGLIVGKHAGEAERAFERRYKHLLARRFSKQVSFFSVDDSEKTVTLHVIPEFLSDEKFIRKLTAVAAALYPGYRVEVKRGERIRAV